MFDLTAEIRLHGLEKKLNQSIRDGSFPFLGHYSHYFYDSIKTTISSELNQSNSSQILFLNCLKRWPAVFATYLVQHVAEGYGARGNFEVYPYIEKALQTELSSAEREKLWEGFRSACLRMGLSVSPRRSGSNYMIEEYLRQAGVPLNYLDDLIEKMIRHAESSGLPDDNDPDAIRLWSQELLIQIRYLPKPVQRSIEADPDGFYVRLFAKAANAQLILGDDAAEIERRLYYNLQDKQGPKRFRRKLLSIPKILFRDSQIGIEIPPGEESLWEIECDNVCKEYPGLLESRFIPLEAYLPTKVSVSDRKGTTTTRALWDDIKNNRFLVFDSNGSFVTSGQLGQDTMLLLEPGEYELLLRFKPEDLEDDICPISDDPELFSYLLSLDPAEKFELQRGTAKALFCADTKPSLVWEGQKYRGVQGNELFASAGLSLEVKIPQDLFYDDSVTYAITLNPGNLGESIIIPFENILGQAQINISTYCENWRPGLSRLLVELKREGFQRAEARTSIFLWNGLERVKNRTVFYCSTLPSPTNFLQGECDNIKIDPEKKIITFKNEDQRLFRMLFQVSENRKQPFTWTVPGVFQQILDYQDSTLAERPVKKGSTLSISTRSREVLEVFSSSNGSLSIGSYYKPIDFNRVGRARIPLAGLVDYLGPGADTLRFIEHETQRSENLLRLVAPHHIIYFQSTQHTSKVVVKFTTKDEVSSVALDIKDMLTGLKKELMVMCHSVEMQGEDGFFLWFSCSKTTEGTNENELQFYLENWPDGAWIINFKGEINERWGRFSNQRNDHFEMGFMVLENHSHRSVDATWDVIQSFPEKQQENIFKRIHRRLLNCYAPQAWESLAWLEVLWTRLADIFSKEEEIRPRVITLAEEMPDDGSSASWSTICSIPGKFPLLYSQPGHRYGGLPNPQQLLTIKSLNILADLKFGVLPLLLDGTLNNLLAFGFSNPLEMMQGQLPTIFNLEIFSAALKQEDISEKLRLLRQHEWQPGDGDYLGALHYRYVEEKLVHNFRASLNGNEYRRGKALYLCLRMQTIPLDGAPQHLIMGPGVLDLSETLYDRDYQGSVEEDHLAQITRFLSQYARACRWEIRKPGTLDKIRRRFIHHLGSERDLELVLGYLLGLGRDLFIYYLMLWEAAFKTDADYQEGALHV